MAERVAQRVLGHGEVAAAREDEDAHFWIRAHGVGEAVVGGDVAPLEARPLPRQPGVEDAVGVIAFVAEFAADVSVHGGGEAADNVRKGWVVAGLRIAGFAVLAQDAGVEAADDFAFFAEQRFAEKGRVDPEILLLREVGAQAGEAREFFRHAAALVGRECGSFEQGDDILALGKGAGLRHRLVHVAHEVGGEFFVVVRGGRHGGQEEDEGEVIAGAGAERAEIGKPRHEHEAVGEKAVLMLEIGGEPGHARDAVALAEEVLRRAPALLARGEEAHEFADRGDVLVEPEELLGLLAFGRAAQAGGHGVHEDEVGGVEDRVGVVHHAQHGARREAVGREIEPPRTESAEVQPHRRCARPAVETKRNRARAPRLRGEPFAIRAGGRVVHVKDICLHPAIILQDRDGAGLRDVFHLRATERDRPRALLRLLLLGLFGGVLFLLLLAAGFVGESEAGEQEGEEWGEVAHHRSRLLRAAAAVVKPLGGPGHTAGGVAALRIIGPGLLGWA